MLNKEEIKEKGQNLEGIGIFMWGYLPAVSQQRAPLLLPTPVPRSTTQEPWDEACSGGCGFALAISGKFLIFKLLTLSSSCLFTA
jgi:hypothetical protein